MLKVNPKNTRIAPFFQVTHSLKWPNGITAHHAAMQELHHALVAFSIGIHSIAALLRHSSSCIANLIYGVIHFTDVDWHGQITCVYRKLEAASQTAYTGDNGGGADKRAWGRHGKRSGESLIPSTNHQTISQVWGIYFFLK